MDISILSNALNLEASLAVPFLAVALLAGFIAGLLRTLLSIDDPVVGNVFKIVAVCSLVYLWGPEAWEQILEFTQRVWGGEDFYL